MQGEPLEHRTIQMVIYLRVSTEEQARRGHSLSEQSEACLSKARALVREAEGQDGQSATVQFREFVDDFGGDVLERPALEQVREFVRTQKPAFFICLDPDRFSRSLKWQLIVADEIESHGTRLVFVQQDYDPHDMMSRAFFQFRGLMSEIDKGKILERTTRGKRGKLKSGGRPNGAAPYGYRHNRETDRLQIQDAEAKWVRQIFHWVVDEGLGIYAVTKRLNELGVPTKRGGGKWYRSVVGILLRNTTYIGEMRCNRKDFRGLASISRLPREKRRPLSAKTRPQEEWVIIPIPPLVDRLLFERAQAALSLTTRRGGRRDTGLLSMLVQCGSCGGPMSYARHSPTRQYLRCPRRYTHHYEYLPETPRCANPHHRVHPIEDGVWETLLSWLTDSELLKAHLTSRDRSISTADQAEQLLRQHDLVTGQLSEKHREQQLIIQKQLKGLLGDTVADTLLASVKQQMDRLDAIRTELTQKAQSVQTRHDRDANVVDSSVMVTEAIVNESNLVIHRLQSLSSTRRRELVLKLIKRVIVNGNRTWLIDPRKL